MPKSGQFLLEGTYTLFGNFRRRAWLGKCPTSWRKSGFRIVTDRYEAQIFSTQEDAAIARSSFLKEHDNATEGTVSNLRIVEV